jgi:aminopeptidase N
MKTGKILWLIVWAALITGVLAAAPEQKEDKSLILPIGTAKFKDKIMALPSGSIVSAEKGKAVDFSRMIREMRESRLVFFGENHDSLPMHDAQFRTIEALYAQDKKWAIGLEMFPAAFQSVLDKWSAGVLTKDEFIREGKWYVNWSLNFGFYEKIFDFAREHRVPIYALNAPRETITTIRMKGWEALSETEKKMIPQPDLSNQEHRLLIRTILESAEIPHQMKGAGLEMMFEGLYRAQAAWDEVMAFNVVEAARKEGRKIVVLAGSGHLLFNLGINRRASEKSRWPSKTVIGVIIPKGKPDLQVSRGLGDYAWGFAEEEKPAFPAVGLSFKKFEGIENLVIDNKPVEGVAKCGDFEKGDIVLSVDGKFFNDINEVRIYLAQFRWGDEARIRVLRNAQIKETVLKFEPSTKSGGANRTSQGGCHG